MIRLTDNFVHFGLNDTKFQIKVVDVFSRIFGLNIDKVTFLIREPNTRQILKTHETKKNDYKIFWVAFIELSAFGSEIKLAKRKNSVENIIERKKN